MIEIRESKGRVTFTVRVQPRASRNEITGEWEGALRVRLTAPPVDDKANEELVRFLAARLNVPLGAVRITRGQRGRSKLVEVRGVTPVHVRGLVGSQPAAIRE
jgi:hypothetical protein